MFGSKKRPGFRRGLVLPALVLFWSVGQSPEGRRIRYRYSDPSWGFSHSPLKPRTP